MIIKTRHDAGDFVWMHERGTMYHGMIKEVTTRMDENLERPVIQYLISEDVGRIALIDESEVYKTQRGCRIAAEKWKER